MGFVDLEQQHTNWANEGVLMLHRNDGETSQRRPCPWGNPTLNFPGPSLAGSKLQMHTPHIRRCFSNDRYRNWLTTLAVLTMYHLHHSHCHLPLQNGTPQHGTARHGTAQHGTAWHSTARHGTAQHSTAQHSTAQHSTAKHSTA